VAERWRGSRGAPNERDEVHQDAAHEEADASHRATPTMA
jgi:hypothetical protein